LPEALVATALLAVGLLAIVTGFQYATSGVETARGETAAVFLAEQRIEELRAQAVSDFSAAALAPGTTTDHCVPGRIAGSASNCASASGAGSAYIRSTTIADVTAGTGCPAAPVACKEVLVRVSYRPVSSTGTLDQVRTVELVTVLGPRT
jgi:Tfp pilus assembly protein PilV